MARRLSALRALPDVKDVSFSDFLLPAPGPEHTLNGRPTCPEVVTEREQLLPLERLHCHVDVRLATATINIKATWKQTKSTATVNCILAVPMPPHAVVTNCEVKYSLRMLTTLVACTENLSQQHTSLKYERGSILDCSTWTPGVFRIALPQVEYQDVVELDIQYREDLIYESNGFSLNVPLTIPAVLVDQLSIPISKVVRITVSLRAGHPDVQWVTANHEMKVVQETSAQGRSQVTGQSAQPSSSVLAPELRLSSEGSSGHFPNTDFCLQFSVSARNRLLPVAHEHTGPFGKGDSKSTTERRFSLLVHPTHSAAFTPLPRAVVILINKSHTLKGSRAQAVVDGIMFVLSSFRPCDKYFCIVFQLDSLITEDGVHTLQYATEEHTGASKDWVLEVFDAELNGSGPTQVEADVDVGTALRPAVSTMFDMMKEDEVLTRKASPESDDPFLRCCFLVTDCEVGEELERDGAGLIIEETERRVCSDESVVRFFPFGIGFDCNPAFLHLIAERTRGACEVCPLEARGVAAQIRAFARGLSLPIMKDVEVFFHGAKNVEIQPISIPDLFRERPIVVRGTFTGSPSPQLMVSGRLADGVLFCEPVTIRKDSSIDWKDIQVQAYLERTAASAWYGQVKELDDVLMNVSCDRHSPCIGFQSSSTMIVVDYTPIAHQNLQQNYSQQLESKGRRALTSMLLTTRVLDKEVSVIGSTSLVCTDFKESTLGVLHQRMQEVERERVNKIAELIDQETMSRSEVQNLWEERLHKNKKALSEQLAQQKLERQAFLRDELAERKSIEKQHDMAFRAMLKYTSEKARIKADVQFVDVSPTLAEVKKINTLHNLVQAVQQSPTRNAPSLGESIRALGIVDYGIAPAEAAKRLENEESVARGVIDDDEMLGWAALQQGCEREKGEAMSAEFSRRELEMFPHLSKKFRADFEKGEGSEETRGRLWKLYNGHVQTSDMHWVLNTVRTGMADLRALLIECLYLLQQWFQSKELMATLVHHQAIGEVIRAMRLHHDIEVQRLGCAILQMAAPKYAQAIDKDGGVVILLQALRGFGEDSALVTSCLKGITHLTSLSPIKRSIARKGGVSLVLKAVVDYQFEPSVLCHAILTMGILGSAGDNGAEAQATIATQGGIELIFQAMRRYPNNLQVLSSCVTALDHLCAHNNFNKAFIMSGGAVSLILSACMSFPNNYTLLFHSVSALGALAANVYACESIVSQGGLALITECITMCPQHVKLLTKARHCLDTLKRVDKDQKNDKFSQMQFIRCIMDIPTKSNQLEHKLIGYSGKVDFTGLYQSIQATFEIYGELCLKFNTETQENVTLTPKNVADFFSSVSNRLLVIQSADERKYPTVDISRTYTSLNVSANEDIILKEQLRSKGILEWEQFDVNLWLTGVLRLPQYVNAFERAGICGKELLKVTDASLVALQITSRKDIARILRSIEELRGRVYAFTKI